MIESWQEFVQNVKEWATARNLINGSTVQVQGLKGLSELGELADNFAKGKDIKDDIGDCCVVAVICQLQLGGVPKQPVADKRVWENPQECISEIAREFAYVVSDGFAPTEVGHAAITLCEYRGIGFIECLNQAWNDIKDRKGIMHNGVFIKESDPRYKELTGGS